MAYRWFYRGWGFIGAGLMLGFQVLLSYGMEPAVPTAAGSMLPPRPALTDDLDRASLQQALQRSLEYLRRRPSDRLLPLADSQISVATLHATLTTFQHLLQQATTPEVLYATVHEHFEFIPAAGQQAQGDVLFTGYYEPQLQGSPVPTAEFTYPLYGRPPDLLSVDLAAFRPAWAGQRLMARHHKGRILPYFTRRQIDVEGKLRKRDLEIVWLRDVVDGFFLHIQGSGHILLPDGHTMRVHYAASNGHPYRSIGTLLEHEGRLSSETMSMQSLQHYLRTHPQERRRILNHNPRYIFFRQVAEGPVGSLGFLLTPHRSIATDSRLFPPAGLAFIQTQKPILNANNEVVAWQDFSRFVFNHDTGSAITGPGRVDLFWGSGPAAAAAAGRMKHRGKLFFLRQRTLTNRHPDPATQTR